MPGICNKNRQTHAGPKLGECMIQVLTLRQPFQHKRDPMATKKSSTNPTRVAAKSPAKPAAKSPAKAPKKSPAKSAAKSPAKSAKKTVIAPASKAIKVVQGVKPSVLNGHTKTTPTQPTRTPAKAVLKAPNKPPLISPHGLVKGKHIVCFWKQNDLGLFGRRPDRWIQMWEQDPKIEKVLVFETPISKQSLEEWLRRAITLEATSASEYRLLLDQAVAKLQGKCDTTKTTYKSFLTPINKSADNQDYLRWVLQQFKAQGIESPTVVLWPACFANEALVKAMNPQQIITDLIDDQRLFPANASLVPTITSQYQTWLKLSDTVVSNSEGLIESFVKEFARQDIGLLPNQALAPQPVTAKTAKPRAGKSTKKRMVVGFVGNMRERMDTQASVSYTHLTLPTICSV